jgi:hypothetical protein
MGSFNEWVKGSYLEEANNRLVVDVANQIMSGAAYLYRVQSLRVQGLEIGDFYGHFYPRISTLDSREI